MMQFVLFILLSGLVINEVMSNPEGRESGAGSPGDRNEFIELYNNSDDTICIDGYFIVDKSGTKDSVIPFPNDSILIYYPDAKISNKIPPYGYALILDPEYIYEGDGTYVRPYDIPQGTILLSVDNTTLGNGLSGSDWLILLCGNDTIDTYGTPSDTLDTMPISPPDGYSVERRNPDKGDSPDNWFISLEKCTPGRKNSVSYSFDIGIVNVDFDPKTPSLGQTIEAKIKVVNFGLENVNNFKIGCEYSETYWNGVLKDFDTASINLTIENLPEGLNNIKFYVFLDNDENPKNDTLIKGVIVEKSPIVINEIMYKSSNEWIELFNNSFDTFCLDSFAIYDATEKLYYLPSEILGPFEYLVIAKDTDSIRLRYGFDFKVVSPLNGFPTLNDRGDLIGLVDKNGSVLEEFEYDDGWGGGYERSLERISPNIKPNISGNWGTCKDEKGATPGRQNSIFMEIQKKQGIFELSKSIFNPLKEKVIFFYNIGEPAYVYFYIFDAKGRLKFKSDKIYTSSGSGEYIWDGGDLPTGLYIILLKAKTLKGKTLKKVKTLKIFRK